VTKCGELPWGHQQHQPINLAALHAFQLLRNQPMVRCSPVAIKCVFSECYQLLGRFRGFSKVSPKQATTQLERI
jgi:hypothetical protein